MTNRNYFFLNEISFKARVFELSHFPVSIKSPVGAIRRVPKIVPYDPDARDADNDGLVQEGTIWERPSGALFRGLQRGARALAGAVDLVDASGNKIDYKPGDSENSPLRGGRVERRIRGRGQRRLNRAERRRQRAQRERNRAPEQREELDALDQQIARLENAVAEDSRQRMLEAEAVRDEFDENMNSFLDGLIEGWSGIKKGTRSRRGDKAKLDAEKLEGERRQVGDANDREPLKDHEDLFDDEILPEEIDRDEHRRKLDEDPDYRKEWNRRLAEEGEHRRADGTVVPPRDEQIPRDAPEADAPEVDAPEVDADEARDIQELIEAVREQDAGSLPDDRSRRNVRNRFPQRGLPEEAFWRNDDYEPREGRDRDAEISEHDRRFGRYYDDDGNLNDRGRLVNEQLREEREEDDAPLSPRERLVEIYQQDMVRIENFLAGVDSDAEEIDNNIDFIDSFVEDVDSSLDSGAISQEERDSWVDRATDVRDRLDAQRVRWREDIDDRDSQIDADMDAEEDRGRVVEGSFSNLKQRMEDEGLRWHSDKLRFLSRLSDEEVEDAFRDAVAQGDARTERRGLLRRDEVSAESKAVAEDYARRIFNKFADDHAEAYFDLEEGEVNPDIFENWEPLQELRETLTEAEWTHLEDAFNNWGRGNDGEDGLSEVYWDQVDGDPENLAEWSPFIEEFEAEVSNANPYNPFEFRPPEEAPDPDSPDLINLLMGDPDSDSPEADLAVQQQENLINEWNDFLDDPEAGDLFRGVDELGQIARGEFPVGDIDPVTPEQRAAFQRLARRQIERRAVERELPGGLTVFDVADMDDDQLNTRIAGLVAADPVGDDLVISSQLRALQAERARRQGFNSNEENLIKELDDEELDEFVADLGSISETLGESAQISVAIEKRNRARANRAQTNAPEEVEPFRVIDEDIPRYELVEDFLNSDEFEAFENAHLAERGGESGREQIKELKKDIERGRYNDALRKINDWQGQLLPALPGDPDPKVPYRKFRRIIESYEARVERNKALNKIRDLPHLRVGEMREKNREVGIILDQVLDGRVSDGELNAVIDALGDFSQLRVRDARANRVDNLALQHRYLYSKRNQLIMIRDSRRSRADADPRTRGLLDMDWNEESLAEFDQDIKDALVHIDKQIASLRSKKRSWENELKSRNQGNVPDENVEAFLPQDMDKMENLVHLRLEFNNKFAEVDSGLFKSEARTALDGNRKSLYQGRRGSQEAGDLHHAAKWRNEIVDRGETLETINGVPQRDLSGLENEDLVRVVLEEMIPNVQHKIGRYQNGNGARIGNDDAELGVAGVDGHIANVDRALAELNRRWDADVPNGEVRQTIKRARTKLRNLRTGSGNTRVNLEREREIRVNAEAARRSVVQDLDVQARDAVQARKDHMEQFSNILAVNGIKDMDVNDRGFDENDPEILEALNAILEDPENPDAPRLYVELNNWAQRASDIGQTHGVDASDFFGGDDNGWQPLTSLPEDARMNNQNFSNKKQGVDQLLSNHKARMNERVFDDVQDRRGADLANMEEMLRNNDSEDLDTLIREVENDFEAVNAPRANDTAVFQENYSLFRDRLEDIKSRHKKRKDRREVDDFNEKAENLLLQIPRNDEGLSPEERKEILGNAITEAMLIENGDNQFSGDIQQYRKLLEDARVDIDREVWRDKRAANGIEELPEQVVRGDINDPAIGNVPRSGLVEHDSNGKPIIRQVPVGNKGMNTQKDANTYLANGGHMKDVPTDFLSDAIFANSAPKHSSEAEGKRFHSDRSRISGGINADAQDPAMTSFEDQATGTIFGIKYHGGGADGGGNFYGENEDIGEVLGADLISHFGLLQGRVTRGGQPMSTRRKRAAPLVFEFAQEITPDGDFKLEKDNLNEYRNVVSGDLLKGVIVDALMHNTDRHGGNYGYFRDRNGDTRLYLIDNSLIDGARDGVQVYDHRVNNVKKYLRGMATSQRDGGKWRGELQRRYRAGDSAIREAVEDFMDRLETFDANALESLILNMMPEVEADRVDLDWLKERVEELRGLGVDAVLELILE